MTVSFTTLTYEEIGRVRRVTMNRPEHHNPLTPRCIREILRAVETAEADAGARVVIVRSTGRSFSSGYGFIAEDTDPGDFPAHDALEGDVTAMLLLARQWGRVWDCAIPVIAQVQGNCLAGGTDLALHCDLVVAAEDAELEAARSRVDDKHPGRAGGLHSRDRSTAALTRRARSVGQSTAKGFTDGDR